MGSKKITAEFQILIHPDFPHKPNELTIVYSTDKGKNWETYLANKITPINWGINIYDLEVGKQIEFFIRIVFDDGRLVLAKKNNQNYKVIIRDNSDQNKYKAQIRITEDILVPIGRKCLVCEEIIRKGTNICQTPGCHAVFCPYCNRMLPPFSNYCPWDEKTFKI